MEEKDHITLVLRRETIKAFCEAAQRAGSSPDEIVESLMQDFLKKEGGIALQSRIDRGVEGKPLREVFKVQIECEDELCRTPRIRMDTRSLAQKHEPDEG